jgi:hypothetical protein
MVPILPVQEQQTHNTTPPFINHVIEDITAVGILEHNSAIEKATN